LLNHIAVAKLGLINNIRKVEIHPQKRKCCHHLLTLVVLLLYEILSFLEHKTSYFENCYGKQNYGSLFPPLDIKIK